MKHALRPNPDQDVVLAYATVAGRLDGRLLVRLGSLVLPAERAAGCLIEPAPGDRVLVSHDASGEAFVLCVLERSSAEPASVGVAGGFTLAAPEATIGLVAGRVLLAASEAVETASPEVTIAASRAEVKAASLNLAGELLTHSFAKVKTVAGAVERTLGRVIERARRVYRRVDEVEDARLGRLRLRVDESLRAKAGRMTLEAEGDVRVDGDKIHLG